MIYRYLITVLLILAPVQAAVSDSVIKLSSDTWHELTMPDGSGLYFDLIRSVFEPAGIRVEIQIVPYARSVQLVKNRVVDGWVASFKDEQPFPLYPKWHFDQNRQIVVALKNKVPSFHGVETLRGKQLIWLRDFNLHKYLPFPVTYREIDDIASAFPMLTAGRADFFIGAESDIRDYIHSSKIDTSVYRFDFLMNLKLYVAFANTERGKRFRTIWDERMTKLHRDPRFREIYTRYGYPIPF